MLLRGKKSGTFFAAILPLLLLSSCSMDLTRLDSVNLPKTVPFFEPITLFYDGKITPLDVQLQRAYTAAVDTSSYPMESCRGNAQIVANVFPDSVNSD